jgi:hypothetical protein
MFDEVFAEELKEYQRKVFEAVEGIRELAAMEDSGDIQKAIDTGYAVEVNVLMGNGSIITITRDWEETLTITPIKGKGKQNV